MGFVNERISEEDRKKYNSFNLIGPYTGRKSKNRHWTIDRDREVYLIALESGREDEHQPDVYAFIWKNKIIKIDAFMKREPKTERHWNMKWIGIPLSLKDEKEVIYEVMLEAFRTHGYLFSNDVPEKDIYFDHLPEPSYYKD